MKNKEAYNSILRRQQFVVLTFFLALSFCNCEHKPSVQSKAIFDKSKDLAEKKTDTVYREKAILFGEEENKSRYPFKISFVSGQVIDIRDVDPYGKLTYPTLRTLEGGFERLYELGDLEIEEQEEILEGSRLNEDATRANNFLRMLTKPPVVAISENSVVVAYHAAYYSNNEDILATQGYALVFNKHGEQISIIQDKKDGFYDIRLSSDGKHLMQKYGIDFGEDGGGQLDRGFRFYNTQSGKMVFEMELGKDPYISSYGNNKKLNNGFHLLRIDPKNYVWYYFLPDPFTVYRKDWPRSVNLDFKMAQIYKALESNPSFEKVLIDFGFVLED